MTPFLLLVRAGIIAWVTLSLVPVEFVFGAIEGELERLGVSVPTVDNQHGLM